MHQSIAHVMNVVASAGCTQDIASPIDDAILVQVFQSQCYFSQVEAIFRAKAVSKQLQELENPPLSPTLQYLPKRPPPSPAEQTALHLFWQGKKTQR